MYNIEIMTEEHDNILRMLKVVREACCRILQGEKPEDEDFRSMIDFVRAYADRHHHGKEEQILFQDMLDHLGAMGQKLITHGMLVEHDMGRLYMSELEEALNRYKKGQRVSDLLDILSAANEYTHLLERHIEKENQVVYPFAERSLSAEIMEEADKRVREFEEKAGEQGVQTRYLALLSRLEEKYL